MGNRFDQNFKFYENIKYINITTMKNENIIISYFILL